MNVPTELITVIPMHHVIIFREVSFVHATLVILVMEQAAQVHLLYLLMNHVSLIRRTACFRINFSLIFEAIGANLIGSTSRNEVDILR